MRTGRQSILGSNQCRKSNAPPGGTQSGIGINLAYSERYSDEMTAVIDEVPDPKQGHLMRDFVTPKLKWKLA